MIGHPSRETQYGMIALSQKGNTCSIQVIFTQSSVSMTTTSEYLPVSGFNVPSLHLSQSSRLHPFQVSKKTNCNNPSNVSHTWPACDSKQLCKFQTKSWKQTHNKSFLFRFKSHRTVSTSYTVQAVSNDSIHAPFKRIHNCNSNDECYLMPLRNQNQHSQTGGVYLSLFSLSPLSTNNLNTKFTVPSVPWRFLFLSLSALQCLNCHQTASGFSFKVTSANVRQAPLFLHTTEPQVFNYSRLISRLYKFLISHMWQSNSLMNQGHWQSKNLTLQVPMPQFLFLTTTSCRHDARLQ